MKLNIRNKKKADEIIFLKKRLTELRAEYEANKYWKSCKYTYMRYDKKNDYDKVCNELNQTKSRLKELGVKL